MFIKLFEIHRCYFVYLTYKKCVKHRTYSMVECSSVPAIHIEIEKSTYKNQNFLV